MNLLPPEPGNPGPQIRFEVVRPTPPRNAAHGWLLWIMRLMPSCLLVTIMMGHFMMMPFVWYREHVPGLFIAWGLVVGGTLAVGAAHSYLTALREGNPHPALWSHLLPDAVIFFLLQILSVPVFFLLIAMVFAVLS